MPIIHILLILAIVGFAVWLVTTLVPMNDTIKRIFIGIACLLICLWIVDLFWDLGSIAPHVRHYR